MAAISSSRLGFATIALFGTYRYEHNDHGTLRNLGVAHHE
jgi:hypothetical protein